MGVNPDMVVCPDRALLSLAQTLCTSGLIRFVTNGGTYLAAGCPTYPNGAAWRSKTCL